MFVFSWSIPTDQWCKVFTAFSTFNQSNMILHIIIILVSFSTDSLPSVIYKLWFNINILSITPL